MSINRSIVIERFVRKERARSQMRVFELSSLAGIYANRCNGDIDAAYRELIKSFDDVGFLGARVLYLHPDVSPPYFRQGPDTDPDPKKPPPPYLPHKLAPIISRQFIKKREKEIGWSEARDGYLAHTWIPARQAARWLQSKGITPPSSISWALTARDEQTPASILKKLVKPIPKSGPKRAARLALDALYPKGVPENKSGQELMNAVNKYIERHRGDLVEGRVKQTVSLDTVLRAAERKE